MNVYFRITATFATIVVCLVCCMTSLHGQTPDSELEKFDQLAQSLLEKSSAFPEVRREVGLTGDLKLFVQILRPQCGDFLVIDDEKVRAHFRDPEDKLIRKYLEKYHLEEFKQEQYLSIPFYIQVESSQSNQPTRSQFIISSKIKNVPVSTQAYYVMMLKAYESLPIAFKASPSAWSYGLCSLVALDASNPHSFASCPDLEIETAIAALLYHKHMDLLGPAQAKQENLVHKSFAEDERRFDEGDFRRSLLAAIRAIGSENPEEALAQLLRSPEEYHAQDQGEQNVAANKPAEKRPLVPSIEPAMRILWDILPSSEQGLRATADYVAKNIKTATLRQVLLSACYDKLCATLAQTRGGTLGNSTMLLRMAIEGHLDELGGGTDAMLEDFERRRLQVWQDFSRDLAARGQDGMKLTDMAYDPASLKWTFRFLYNYSLPLRKREKTFREEIAKNSPGASALQIDREICKHLTSEQIEQWWRTDPLINELFETVGRPLLEIYDSKHSQTGKVLDCRWRIPRQGLEDIEEIRIQIVDTFSSGGGKPTPGVSGLAKVVVRKTLQSQPEVIELKNIKKNFYVQTISDIVDSPDGVEYERGKDSEKEDWARVVQVHRKNTRSPWKLDSGAAQPLEIGRKQQVRVRFQNQKKWLWRIPLSFRAEKDSLLGIQPEGVIPPGVAAAFDPATITESSPNTRSCELIILKLSHGDVKKVKDTGVNEWGYFADSRFVQAEIYPAPQGVDGEALAELPEDVKPLQDVAIQTQGSPGDKINAFDYRNPNTFIDVAVQNKTLLVKYFIDIAYQFPDESAGAIRVAEGQRLVVFDKGKQEITLKKAYQLKLGQQLVCGFDGRGSPQLAEITGLKGQEAPLGVSRLRMKCCELIRVNGILVPVNVEPTIVYAGVDVETLIQMSPPHELLREASEDNIDLSQAEVLTAKDVQPSGGKQTDFSADDSSVAEDGKNMVEAENNSQTASRKGPKNNILSYNWSISPKFFWQANVVEVKDHRANRYMRIVTPHATLTCGHLQEIYVTENDWPELHAVQASMVKPGEHKIAWLCPAGRAFKWSSSDMAENSLTAALDRTVSRMNNSLPVAQTNVQSGKIQLVPVTAVRPMFPSKAVPYAALREFKVSDTRIARLGLRPNMFANGIMVKVRFDFPGEEGEGEGRRGPTPRPAEVSKEHNPGPERPSWDGFIRDWEGPEPKIDYSPEDIEQLERNRKELDEVSRAPKLHRENIRKDVLDRFLALYFSKTVSSDQVYANIQDYFTDYSEPRNMLIKTGNARLFPAVVNSYVFLADLLYEAGANEAGDALTRDFLCLTVRSINKAGGKNFYADPKFRVRYGLMTARDLVLYVRDKSSVNGFSPLTKVVFPAAGFENVLKQDLIGKQKISKDIYSDDSVNMYNLCRQLDKWSNWRLPLFESLVCPRLRVSELFTSGDFRKKLGTIIDDKRRQHENND